LISSICNTSLSPFMNFKLAVFLSNIYVVLWEQYRVYPIWKWLV
jgi:hypothetical protein